MTFEFFVYFVFRVFCGLKVKSISVRPAALALTAAMWTARDSQDMEPFVGGQRAWHCRDDKIFAKKRTTEKCAAL